MEPPPQAGTPPRCVESGSSPKTGTTMARNIIQDRMTMVRNVATIGNVFDGGCDPTAVSGKVVVIAKAEAVVVEDVVEGDRVAKVVRVGEEIAGGREAVRRAKSGLAISGIGYGEK